MATSRVDRHQEARRLKAERGHLARLVKEGAYWYWYAPSRTVCGKEYKLPYHGDSCTCPDHEQRGATCAHMLLVAMVRVERARWERARARQDSLRKCMPGFATSELEALATRLGI
jgi:hypothetical protein